VSFKLNISIVRHATIEDFQQHYYQWLMEKEDLNNSLLSLVLVLLNEEHVFGPPYWFGGVETDDKIIGCGIHARPDGMLLTEVPDVALPYMIESLGSLGNGLRRVYGPVKTVEMFADLWCEKFNVARQLQSRWHIYRVSQLNPQLTNAQGNLRPGENSDLGLVREWGHAYGKERPAPLDVADFMSRKLESGDLYIWENGNPMTLITLSGRTDHGIRISAVYTPPEYRGHGYASAAVTAVSQSMLDAGDVQWITLSAEIDDPAERIYKRLGYDIIGNRACYTFD
jgi:hypothetical protein